MKKILSHIQLRKICRELHNDSKKIVTTNGVFDIIHVGHIDSLTRARQKGDVLIVALNADASVRKNKGPHRPINNLKARQKVIAALECVDYVTHFNEQDPRALLTIIKPAVHIKGGDYRLSDIIEREIVEKNGGHIVLLKPVAGFSTTGIIEKIKSLITKGIV